MTKNHQRKEIALKTILIYVNDTEKLAQGGRDQDKFTAAAPYA